MTRSLPKAKLASLAFRNLFRNPRRTGLLVAILAVGAASLIVVGGFLDDLMVHMREDFIHTQNGHIQISRPGFVDEGVSAPLDFLIEDFAGLEAALLKEEHVSHVIPRLKLRGMASAGQASLAIQLIGVDPVAENAMGGYRHTKRSNLSFQIVEGRNLQSPDLNQAVAGKALLDTLRLPLNQAVNFLTLRQAGALDGGNYAVVGSFQTFMKAFDERTLMVPLKAAQNLIGQPDTVNSVLILLDETGRTDEVLPKIQAMLQERHLPLEAIPWYRQADYYHQCRAFLDKIFAAVIALIAAIFIFTVSNVMSLVLRERTREFGTMMALGNERSTVLSVILFEAGFLGLISAGIGLALGYGLAVVITTIGIPMPPPPQGSAGYEAVIALSWTLFAKVAALTCLAPLLGAVIPAIQCTRKSIVRALGYV